jgi:hypothetical protein
MRSASGQAVWNYRLRECDHPKTRNQTANLFRVSLQSFRVDAARNQMCSEFEGIFDLPGRLFVQSSDAISSENGPV